MMRSLRAADAPSRSGAPRRAEGTNSGHFHRGIIIEGRQDARRRSASMVLPEPGGPVSSMWWPPAAAISGRNDPATTGDIAHIEEFQPVSPPGGARLRLRAGGRSTF